MIQRTILSLLLAAIATSAEAESIYHATLEIPLMSDQGSVSRTGAGELFLRVSGDVVRYQLWTSHLPEPSPAKLPILLSSPEGSLAFEADFVDEMIVQCYDRIRNPYTGYDRVNPQVIIDPDAPLVLGQLNSSHLWCMAFSTWQVYDGQIVDAALSRLVADGADIEIKSNLLGSTTRTLGSLQSVPEPDAMMLGLMCWTLAALARRTRKPKLRTTQRSI